MPLWSSSIIQGFKTARKALPLAIIPFAIDLLMFVFQQDPITLQASVEFSLPVPLPSIAQIHGQVAGALPFFPVYPPPEMGELTAVLLLLFLGIQSYATAGYLGLLDGTSPGRPVRRFFRFGNLYFSRIFAFNALVAVILLAMESFISDPTPTLLLSVFILAALLAFLYFVFLTPFCIVVDDYSLGPAFRRSVELAYGEWREVVPYCLAYAMVTIVTSATFFLILPGTTLGFFIAVGVYGLLGTALVASTLHLYRGLQPQEELAVPVRPAIVEEVTPT